MSHSEFPLSTWILEHQNQRNSPTWKKVRILFDAYNTTGTAVRIEEACEAWFDNKSLPTPDLVKCVGLYGYSRQLISGWKEFPIEVPADKVEAWREAGLGANMREFREYHHGGIAGGFMELATKDPRLTADTLKHQLSEKLDKLTELTAKPVEWYTPQEFTEEELIEMEDSVDNERIEEPFLLFEQLTCFVYALPKFRIFSMTEEEPEFGLPSMELYHALGEIDLNSTIGRLNEFEPKLRAILKFLATEKHLVNIDSAPEGFWWRHWKAEAKPRQSRNRRPQK